MTSSEREEDRRKRMLAQQEIMKGLGPFLPDPADVSEDIELDLLLQDGASHENFSLPAGENLIRGLFVPRAKAAVAASDPRLNITGHLSIHREAGHLIAQLRREDPSRRAIAAKLIVQHDERNWSLDFRIGQQTEFDTVVVLGTDDELFDRLKPIRDSLGLKDVTQIKIDLILVFDDPPDDK